MRPKNTEQRSPKQSKQGAQKRGLTAQNSQNSQTHVKSHSFVNPKIAEMLQNINKNSYVASIPV